VQRKLPLATRAEARTWIRGTMREHRSGFTVVFVLTGLATAAGLAGPQILGHLVDGAASGAGAGSVDLLALAFGVLIVAQGGLKRAARLRAGVLGERILAANREAFVGEALKLPLGTVEAAGTGDLLSRATSDTGRIDFAVRHALPEISVAAVTVLATIVAMVVTSPLLSLSLLISVPLVGLPTRWYWRRSPRVIEKMLDSWADVQSGLHESAEGARTTEALGLTGRRIRANEDGLQNALHGERFLRRLQLRWVPWVELSHVAPLAAMLLLGGWAFAGHQVELGTITTMVIYAQALGTPLDEVLWWVEDLQVAGTALRRVLGVRGPRTERATAATAPAGRDLEIRGVRFGYAADREVLHGIDLRVPRGERLAIVGPSGAGKSTLGRLLAGIAEPTAGSVTIGGVEVSSLPDDLLRTEVLLLTQEHHVFSGTLRENLTLPVRHDGGDWTDAELFAALGSAGAREWARALPDGLDTRLGTGAVAVPAAMAQQLALARVVLADPQTVVLDEATSLLDTSSARELERSLGGVLAGRTVIAIAHRLHTAAAADRVAVMTDGHIAELGSHAELLAANGPYAHLVEAAHVTT
jgi:ABC-type multidrug transport system fused ATPase/permease subunit